MNKIRRLQYVKNQYFLNVPVEFVKFSKLQKGDYFEVMLSGDNNFVIRKAGENNTPRENVILDALRNEAHLLSMTIGAIGSTMSSGEFSGRLAQQSHIQAKIRKLENKLKSQN